VSRSDAALGPKFVSPNSAYFVSKINSYNGITTFPSWLQQTTTVALTTGNGGNCTVSGSTETCTVSFPTYPGTVSYTFSLEDSAQAVLATHTGTYKIAQGKNTVIDVTFQGIPASVAISVPVTEYSHRAFTQHITVTVKDASGAQITSGDYGAPVTLSTSDTTGATQLSVNQPTSTSGFASSVSLTGGIPYVRLQYSGLAIAPFTLVAKSGSTTIGSAVVTPVLDPIVPSGTTYDTLSSTDPNYHQQTLYIDTLTPSPTPSFSLSELGWSNAPYDKTFTVTPDPQKCSSSVATIASTDDLTFQVTPQSAGYCKLNVSGGGGLTSTVWVSISTVTIGVNGRHR
jgi:hypothetical protein